MDDFRDLLVGLRETHIEFEKDIVGGFGISLIEIRPGPGQSLLKAPGCSEQKQ